MLNPNDHYRTCDPAMALNRVRNVLAMRNEKISGETFRAIIFHPTNGVSAAVILDQGPRFRSYKTLENPKNHPVGFWCGKSFDDIRNQAIFQNLPSADLVLLNHLTVKAAGNDSSQVVVEFERVRLSETRKWLVAEPNAILGHQPFVSAAKPILKKMLSNDLAFRTDLGVSLLDEITFTLKDAVNLFAQSPSTFLNDSVAKPIVQQALRNDPTLRTKLIGETTLDESVKFFLTSVPAFLNNTEVACKLKAVLSQSSGYTRDRLGLVPMDDVVAAVELFEKSADHFSKSEKFTAALRQFLEGNTDYALHHLGMIPIATAPAPGNVGENGNHAHDNNGRQSEEDIDVDGQRNGNQRNRNGIGSSPSTPRASQTLALRNAITPNADSTANQFSPQFRNGRPNRWGPPNNGSMDAASVGNYVRLHASLPLDHQTLLNDIPFRNGISDLLSQSINSGNMEFAHSVLRPELLLDYLYNCLRFQEGIVIHNQMDDFLEEYGEMRARQISRRREGRRRTRGSY